ncbi:unnamed protein product [Parnassius apollo]|uniref:(apollo) hypothetical protein n=1 Tax=Parnassius apollo TaxID=110799 RepID=A0A8S3Y0E2_PARAO|nr:unnamed protein product [Parnassius apollo]
MALHTRLFVGNIPENFNEFVLRENFSKYGQVLNLEIKNKAGSENDNKRFAFITLAASNYDVETCIKEFSSTDFDGHMLYVTRARESFLERLQRERIQASKKDDEKNVQNKNGETGMKENPIINLNVKLNPPKRNDNYNTTKHNNGKKKRSDFHQRDGLFYENSEASAQNDKKQDSEIKRLESLKRKRQEFKEKKSIIKSGLIGIDNVQNKKVIFSDNDFENEELYPSNYKSIVEKQSHGQRKSLFDEEETDTEVNFDIKKQFEGKKGQKVLDLQSRYKSDKRFVLDERFIDDYGSDHESTVDHNEGVDLEQTDEKSKQLNILQDVLGVSIKRNNFKSTQKSKIKMGMLRFDPMHPDHAKFLAPAATSPDQAKKSKKKKPKDLFKENQEEIQPEGVIEKVEVSKEQFYKVSDTLKEAMIEPSSFSLRNLFAKESNEKESEERNSDYVSLPNEKVRKSRNPLDTSEKNPFVYDSSDSECDENKTENNVLQEKPEVKAVWRENLFFTNNDYRLKDGLLFFNKCDEEQKERRGLKSIMKKRIYNKERKNQMFKKKIGGRKKSMKKSMRK